MMEQCIQSPRPSKGRMASQTGSGRRVLKGINDVETVFCLSAAEAVNSGLGAGGCRCSPRVSRCSVNSLNRVLSHFPALGGSG